MNVTKNKATKTARKLISYFCIIAMIFTMMVGMSVSAFAADIDPEFFFNEIQQIGASEYHNLYLMNDGTVWTCGGLSDLITVPKKVQGLTDVICVAAAPTISFAVKSDGTLWTWGEGNQTSLSQAAISDVTCIYVSQQNSYYVLKSDGTVWCWGTNNAGQLGDGTKTNKSIPVQVKESSTTPLTDVQAVSVGHKFALFLKSDGTVWSCGGSTYGELGRTGDPLYAMQISGLTDVIEISAGSEHCLALTSNGMMWAWGLNSKGQLGEGTQTNRTSPVMVTNGISNVKAIAAAGSTTEAMASITSQTSHVLKTDGTVWSWGYNFLGNNNNFTDMSIMPVQVNKLRNIKSITATNGVLHAGIFAIGEDGSAWGWGHMGGFQIGAGIAGYLRMPIKINEPDNSSGSNTFKAEVLLEIDQDEVRLLDWNLMREQ